MRLDGIPVEVFGGGRGGGILLKMQYYNNGTHAMKGRGRGWRVEDGGNSFGLPVRM